MACLLNVEMIYLTAHSHPLDCDSNVLITLPASHLTHISYHRFCALLKKA